MSKYIDADRLRAEIDKQEIGCNIDGKHAAEYDTCVKILRIIDSLQQEQQEVDLENYISNKLHELGADLINHKPYSFNRGLNVGKTNAYNDILDRLNTRKE